MSEEGLIPEPWGSFLRELDELAVDPVDFHCIGGFVVTKKYGFQRETSDVDVISIAPNTHQQDFLNRAGEGSELHQRYNVYLDLVTVIEAYPEDYETRLTEMYPRQLKHIRLLAPEAHDLALMKLGRNIERDREDVKFLARQRLITAEGLQQRYQTEMQGYIAEPEKRADAVLIFWIEMIREELERTCDSDTQ